MTRESVPERLATYGELAELLDLLPTLVREKRRVLGLSARATCKAIGVASSSVGRWEAGHAMGSSDDIKRVLRWLDEPWHVDTK